MKKNEKEKIIINFFLLYTLKKKKNIFNLSSYLLFSKKKTKERF